MIAFILKIYPWMLHSLGLAHLFGFHAIVLIIGAIFVVVFLPETRGLTLTELATLFGGKVKSSQNELTTEEENDRKEEMIIIKEKMKKTRREEQKKG